MKPAFAWLVALFGCTPPSRALPVVASVGGSAEGGSSGGCDDASALWVDNVAGDNAAAGTEAAPVADLDAALARGDGCAQIRLVATGTGYAGACILRDDVTILGVGGRPRIDAPVVCDERLVGLFVRASHVRLEHLEIDISANVGVEARAVVFSGTPMSTIADAHAIDVLALGPGATASGRALMSSSLCSGCSFERCTVRDAEGAGIDFQNHQDDITIAGNTIQRAGAGCIGVNGEPAAAQVGDDVLDGISRGVHIVDNRLEACGGDPAIHLASVREAEVIGNVVAGAPSGALLLDDDGVGEAEFASYDALVAHNTFDCRDCESPAIRVRSGTGNHIVDNIVLGAIVAADVDGAEVAFDHNAYEPEASFVHDGEGASWAQWRDLGFDVATLVTPTAGFFVDADGGDYHLVATALAIDAGVDVGVTHDLDGTARPQGAAVDLGAYEFIDDG
ncbi:MAG: right-handed parallel beta-helix repeat-containing protein [Deltaproteobacteria bacterium]|nr:right-handed parallel beta-helix repeat-containing protein [Deltaproteobacteria bacterium]